MTATRRLLAASALLASGCSAVTHATEKGLGAAEFHGLLSGHAGLPGPASKPDPALGIGLAGFGGRAGELVSLDAWPVIGIGGGASGFRFRLLGVEIALGTALLPPSLPDDLRKYEGKDASELIDALKDAAKDLEGKVPK